MLYLLFDAEHCFGQRLSFLLQTDTSLAIEAKTMRRWEFDSIAQAASCSSLWFSGTISDLLKLKDFLDSARGILLHLFYYSRKKQLYLNSGLVRRI